MIPLDLLFALSPSFLLAGLWVADWIRGSWSPRRCGRSWPRCGSAPGAAGWTVRSSSSSSWTPIGEMRGLRTLGEGRDCPGSGSRPEL